MKGIEQTVSTVFASIGTELLKQEHCSLPLHITVLPKFIHDKTADHEVGSLLSRVLSRHEAIIIEVGEEDYFGTPDQVERREIHVRKIGGAGLHAIHNELLGAMMWHVPPFPGMVIDATYVGPSYNPHVSDNNGKALGGAGDKLLVSELYLARRPLHAPPQAWEIAEVFQLRKRGYDKTAS